MSSAAELQRELCLFLPDFSSEHRWMLKRGITSETYVCGCGMLASALFAEDPWNIFLLFFEGKDVVVHYSASNVEGNHTTEYLFIINLFLRDFLKLSSLYSQPNPNPKHFKTKINRIAYMYE